MLDTVLADEAKSNAGTLSPSVIFTPVLTPKTLILVLQFVVVVEVDVAVISDMGVSTSCCRFLNSEDLKLVDRLSLDASEVERGELRSTDEATS